MGLFSRKTPVKPEVSDAHIRALRRTMQNIVIAHAMICYKHMAAEDLEAAREEWAATVKGKGWVSFFADDDTPLPAPSWEGLTEGLTEPERSGSGCVVPSKQT
jgi:hypothetical protein